MEKIMDPYQDFILTGNGRMPVETGKKAELFFVCTE